MNNYLPSVLREFKVYKHTCMVTNKTYIGITSQKLEDRWRDGDGYRNNIYFTRSIKKYGWDGFRHELLFFGLTQEEACIKEKELIKYYKSQKLCYNITDGGEGVTGYKHTEETKKILKEKLSGTKAPNYGKKFSEKTRKKQSLSHLGKHPTLESRKKMSISRTGSKNPMYGVPSPMLGKHHTPEVKKFLSDLMKGVPKTQEARKNMSKNHADFSGKKNPMYGMSGKNSPNSRKVAQLDLNGNLIKNWDCISDVSRTLGIDSSSISKVCRGKIKKFKGFIWKYI